jgi:outer membrane protein TolC
VATVDPATPAPAKKPVAAKKAPLPHVSVPPYASATPAAQPTPWPVNTLAPLTSTPDRQYPIFGTPVPGVNAGSPAPDVPASLSLPQSILVAFARSPALDVARGDVDVQAAIVRLQSAGLLPSLSGEASVARTHSQAASGLSASGAVFGASTSTNASFAATLKQLIFDGGRVAAGISAARSNEAATADNYHAQLLIVAFNVATAYYNYLAAERTTQVDLEIVRQDLVQEDLVRAQVRAGTEARAQLATAQLPTAQARVAAVKAQGAELAAAASYANAMGLDANVAIQPVDDSPVFTNSPISVVPIPTYADAVKRALALRPDYDAAVRTVDAAGASLRGAQLGLFPTLSGSASASTSSTDPRAGTFRNAQQLGLALSIPIFDQGVTAANTAQAKANLGIAQANARVSALGIQLDVKKSLTSLVSARAALDQTEQEYTTAVTNLQSTQAQYRAGVTTLPLLLNAQVQLTQALTDQVNSVYALRQAEQGYLFAIGANFDASGRTAMPAVVRTGG